MPGGPFTSDMKGVTTMLWTMDPRKMPNGTVLFLGISYATAQVGDTRGRTEPKIYTYAALKQAGVWYFSGAGKVPQAAGWGAVERWLERDNRVLEWVKIVSALEDVYTRSPEVRLGQHLKELAAAEPGNCPHHPDDPGTGECHLDSCRDRDNHCGWETSCLDVDTSQADE